MLLTQYPEVPMRLTANVAFLCLIGSLIVSAYAVEPKPAPADQAGESIVVCGQKVPIGTKVILWSDPGGFDAYAPKPAGAESAALGFRSRRGLTPAEEAEVAKNGWTLPLLQEKVDQFVIHYDVCGTSGRCFDVLRKRGLAVQFMLDLDGTIYQTVDLKECAWHATKANDRSVGIEIANMGAYPTDGSEKSPLDQWYKKVDGQTVITLPAHSTVPTRPANAPPLQPSRPELVVGKVQGRELAMYDLTPEQYRALAKLTAGLCVTFPKIHRDVPRDAEGKVVDHALEKTAYGNYKGILGHFHVQTNKTDPGPAFQWDKIIKNDQK